MFEKYRHKRKISSHSAADVCITNCGGTILWLGNTTADGEYIYAQEEIGFEEVQGFSRLLRKKIFHSRKGSYVKHNGRRYYFSDFYRRTW